MHELSSPENRLWITVLATFAEDAASIYRAKRNPGALRYELQSAWCADMCELVDVEHHVFIEAIESILAGRKVERMKKSGGMKHEKSRTEDGHGSLRLEIAEDWEW